MKGVIDIISLILFLEAVRVVTVWGILSWAYKWLELIEINIDDVTFTRGTKSLWVPKRARVLYSGKTMIDFGCPLCAWVAYLWAEDHGFEKEEE